MRPMGLRLRPRLNRRRARAWTTSRSCSLERSRSLRGGFISGRIGEMERGERDGSFGGGAHWSRSMPR